MQPSEPSLVESIVGDAMGVLSELAVNPQLFGAFALRFGPKVARRVAEVTSQAALQAAMFKPQSTQPSQQELQHLIDVAVSSALERLQERSQGIRALVDQSDVTTRVKVGPHGSTSVNVPNDLLARAREKWGSTRKVNAVVRSIYDTAPAGVTRKSRWVVDRLIEALASV